MKTSEHQNMKLFMFIFITIIHWVICKNGLVQEIIPWDERSADVTPSIRSLQPSNNALAVNYIDDFDSIVKQHQGYIQKVRGFFKAPESGEYKFYSSCSGPCQIFIGQDEKAKPKQIIAQKEESLHNEFNRYPDQVSHTIYLEQGRLYFIEGIEKQHGGLGHLSVGVVLPSDRKILPISKSYLRATGNGNLKRKGEILRSNGKELTKQRDKMFTKLKEINEYIRKLTDAVKTTAPRTRGRETMSAKKADRSGEFNKSTKDETNEMEMERLTPMEMGKSIKGDNRTPKEVKGEEIKNGEIKSGYLKNNINSIDEHHFENEKHNTEKDVSQKPFDRNEYTHIENVEFEGLKEDTTRKENTGLKPNKYAEDGRKELKEMDAERKNDEEIQMGGLHELWSSRNDKKLNTTRINKADNIGLSSEVGNKERNTESIGRKNKSGDLVAPQIGNDINQNFQMKSSKPNNDVTAEENYEKDSKSRVQTEGLHNIKFGVEDNEEDNDEIIQLTSYAKKEISKHGDLSEQALKHLIKVIKYRLISDGYIKKQYGSILSNEPTQIFQPRQQRNITMNRTSRNQTDDVTKLGERNGETTSLRDGQIMMYDRVVSNLMKIMKESKQLNDNENDHDIDKNDIFKLKPEMIKNEKDQRTRLLSSLYLLSNEIENFKQFLKDNKKTNLEEQPRIEGEYDRKLKDETTEGKTFDLSFERPRIEKSVSKFTTKWNEVGKDSGRNNESNLSVNDGKSENRYNISKYKIFDNVERDGKDSSMGRYNSDRNHTYHNDNGYMIGGNNEIKSKTDDAKVRPRVPNEIANNITPEENSDGDESTQTEITRNANGMARHVSSKPLLIEGYTQLVRKVSDQSKTNEQSSEERYANAQIKTTHPSSPPVAVNASKRNSYTDTLARTVEQYLSGTTVPALLGEQITNGASELQRTNDQYTRVQDSQRDNDMIHTSSQRYKTPIQNVQGSKKTFITKHFKKKTSKRKMDKDHI